MKARTRGLYLVLIGAAAVAAWQECGELHGLVFTRSVAYAQTVPPAVPPEPALSAAPEAGSPLIVPPVPSPAPSPAEKLPPSRPEAPHTWMESAAAVSVAPPGCAAPAAAALSAEPRTDRSRFPARRARTACRVIRDVTRSSLRYGFTSAA